jgi:hypothetical protein
LAPILSKKNCHLVSLLATDLGDELDEEESHLFEELVVAAAQRGERLLGDARQQLLRVDLGSTS